MPIGNQEETHSTPSDAVNAVNNNDVKVDTDTTMTDVPNQKHKILTSLASSYSGPVLKNAFNNNNNNIDDDDDDDDENDLLTKSCFASISLEKFGLEDAEEDEELTSLAWLHNTDVLKSLNTGDRSLCTSPIDEDFKENGGLYNPYSTQHPHNVPYNPLKHIGSKPPYSFSCLIFMSIEDSPHKKLPVKEIYNWILRHFPYFQNAPTGWKNSVRHNLSLNKCFKKVDKERGQSVGKGSLWCIDPAFRPNLLQALRKTPYHPYQQLQMLSTASPAAAATNTSASNNPHLANILPKISNGIPGIKTELPEHVNAPPPDLFPFLSRRMALSKPDSDVTDIDVANTLVSLKEMSKLHQGYTGRSAARGVMRSSRSPSPPEFGSVRDRLQKHLYSQFLPIPSDVTPHPYADHSYSLVDLPTPDSTPPRSPSPSATHDATTSKRTATITDGSGTSPEPTPRKLTATPSTTQGKRRAMLQKLTASAPAVKGKRGRKKCKTDEMEETEKNRAESKTKQSKQALAQHKQKTSSQEDDGDDKQSLHAEDTLQVTDQPQRRMSSRVRRRKRRWSSSESPEPAPRQKEKQKKLRKKREKQPEKLQRGSATSGSSAPKRGRSTTRRSSTTGGSSSGGGGSRRGADSAESSIDGEYEFEEREVLGSPVKQEVMDPDLAELTQSLNLNAVKAEAPDGDNSAGSRARAASNESESDSGSELSDMEEELELQEQHRLAREQYRMELRAQALKARLRGDALMTMPPPPPTALMSTRSSRAEKDSSREQRKQEGTRGRKTLDSNSAASTSHNDKKSSSGGLGTGAGTSTDEEERRIVEGAGALLNFAGISTSNFSGMMTRRRTATQRQADAINNNDKSSKRRRLSKTKPSSTAQSLPSSSRMMTTRSVQPSTAAVLHSVDQGLPVVQVKEEKDDDAEYQKASSNVPADDSDSDLDGNVGHDLDAEVMFEVKQEPPAVVEPNDSSEPLALDNDDN